MKSSRFASGPLAPVATTVAVPAEWVRAYARSPFTVSSSTVKWIAIRMFAKTASYAPRTADLPDAVGHEDAALGVELFDSSRVPGVQGRFIGGQQRAQLFRSGVLHARSGGEERERQQPCGEARAMCHVRSESWGGTKATSRSRSAVSRVRPR